jgi:predicted histidine transporter YuiF (NhaC family)
MISASTGQVIAAGGRWHLGIGDPDAIAWCIVGAYVVAVALAGWAWQIARRGARLLATVNTQEAANERVVARIWLLVALVMLSLGINKQLDLQTWFLQTMRRRAYEGGWYADRRSYQTAGIVAAMILTPIAAGIVVFLLRRVVRRMAFTIAGLCTLVLFVVIRAISFHYVDKLLELGGRIGVNVILELSGIGLIIVSVLWWQHTERARLVRVQEQAMQRRRAARATNRPALAEPAPIVQ